jgi:hypothetical protein
MGPDERTALFNVDMRGPSQAADCLDGIAAFPAAVDHMRAIGDEQEFPATMLAGTRVSFDALDASHSDALRFVAAVAQDQLYRHISKLTILDKYTRAYCAVTIRHFFEQLSSRQIRTFYILDNTLRDDRFAAVLELFALSGIATITPRRDGTSWSELSARIQTGHATGGHAAYIEPDVVVNHLDAAQKLASETDCIATFRNISPDDPRIEILRLK